MATTVGPLGSLEKIAENAQAYFAQKNLSREQALARSREVIRASANAIRAVHRRDFDRAQALLDGARVVLDNAVGAVQEYGDVRYAGFIHDAQKEYAEAFAVLTLLSGRELPAPSAVGVEWPAYLNGLGEAVGELRRYLLDDLRRGDLSAGEALLRGMDEIYGVLVTMDYPDGITGGLRRTTDVVRGILEKTRGDLTVAMRQADLERRLQHIDDDLRRLDHAQTS